MAEREQQITITTDTGAAIQGISELKQNIEAASEAAQTLNDALAATGSAMAPGGLDGAYADIAASAREAADALSELMEQATALESTLSASTGSMPDFSASVEKLDSLKISLESVIEIQERLSTGAGDMDTSAPWEEFEEKMQSVVEVYVQVRETVTATAESVAESESAQQAAAEKKADAVIAAYQKEQAQVTQSLGELKAQLEEYKLKMEEAAAAGDKIGQADAIKGIEEMTGRIKELGKAQEQSAGRALGMTSGIRNLFAMFSTGQVSARGLIVSIKSIGTAIKTGLGPVGWGILILEGLSEAVNVFWNHLQGKSKAAAEEAEAARKKAEEEAKKMQEIKMDAVKAENAHKIRENSDYMYRMAFETTLECKRQTREIQHQLELKKGQIDQEVMNINSERDKNTYRLKMQGIKEGWSDEQLTTELQKNEDSRALELLDAKKKKITAEQDATTKSMYQLAKSYTTSIFSLVEMCDGMIKGAKDVDLFVKQLLDAYADRSAKNDRFGFMNDMAKYLTKIKPTMDEYGKGEGGEWAAKSFVDENRSDFNELGKKLNLSDKEIIAMMANGTGKLIEMIENKKKEYSQEYAEINERIGILEGEIKPNLKGVKKDENGQYGEDDLKGAAAEKGNEIDRLKKERNAAQDGLGELEKKVKLLAQQIETVEQEGQNKQEEITIRDTFQKSEREVEAKKYQTQKALEKMIEAASIERLTKMYEDAQAALDTANQSGSKKDIQEAEQLADKIKKALDDKKESSDKMTKEIEDVIAKALKDKTLSKKDKQGLSQMQEMLKKAASDGNLEGEFKALAYRLQSELDNIKRQMNKRKN